MTIQPSTVTVTNMGSGAQRVSVKTGRLSAYPVDYTVREVQEKGKSAYQVQNWKGHLLATADTFGLAIAVCVDSTN